MNRIGAFGAARKRTPRIFSIVLACLAAPTGLVAQTLADRESVARVVETLFPLAREYTEIPHIPGTWSLVIARFAKGDSREIAIPAKAGQDYEVWGAAESVGTDIDICIYGPTGDPVACQTDEDSVPIVFFTPKTEGTYRAVMTAVSVEGGGTSFAGMVVLRDIDDGAERRDREVTGPERGRTSSRLGRVLWAPATLVIRHRAATAGSSRSCWTAVQ